MTTGNDNYDGPDKQGNDTAHVPYAPPPPPPDPIIRPREPSDGPRPDERPGESHLPVEPRAEDPPPETPVEGH
jgi:hypothetical protein